MGTTSFQLQDLVELHGRQVNYSTYTLYGDMSARVMDTFREYTPLLEVYSIYEAFLDFIGIGPQDLTGLARKIRATVGQATGITVSIGIAPTKTLAKMANRFAKKHRKVG